jgi:3-oxoacyl-[acyl-carrier protein] reductase
MSFSGRVVLITGGSRGIGRACAKQFADHGACVAINYRTNRRAAEETLRSLRAGPHEIFQADVADTEAAAGLVDDVATNMGKIDILVNSAGIYEQHDITKQNFDEWKRSWDRTIGINLLGAAHVTFAVVKQMMRQGGGRIVNVSSRGAFRGEPLAPAYGASKAGLNALSQSLAQALAPHRIYVFAVAPGFVDTDMAKEPLSGPLGETVRRESPIGRVATAEEVARAVVFLASDGSEYMTGCVLDINGASYLRT